VLITRAGHAFRVRTGAGGHFSIALRPGLYAVRVVPAATIGSGLSPRSIRVPAAFIAGKSDWGTYQFPGSFERMQSTACERMTACHLVEGAGHWVQQEQPEETNRLLLSFLRELPA